MKTHKEKIICNYCNNEIKEDVNEHQGKTYRIERDDITIYLHKECFKAITPSEVREIFENLKETK